MDPFGAVGRSKPGITSRQKEVGRKVAEMTRTSSVGWILVAINIIPCHQSALLRAENCRTFESIFRPVRAEGSWRYIRSGTCEQCRFRTSKCPSFPPFWAFPFMKPSRSHSRLVPSLSPSIPSRSPPLPSSSSC